MIMHPIVNSSLAPLTRSRIHRFLVLRALQGPLRELRKSRLLGITSLLEPLLGVPENELDNMPVARVRQLGLSRLQSQPRLTPADVVRPYPVLRTIAADLELTETAQAVLLVLVWLKQERLWKDLSSALGELTRQKAVVAIAGTLGARVGDVQEALQPMGALVRSGLVSLSSDYHNDMESLFGVLEGLSEYALRTRKGWDALMGQTFQRMSGTGLTLHDFNYLQPQIDGLVEVLRGGMTQGCKGIHILLHGEPGTGKSALARVLAGTLRAELRAVRTPGSGNRGTDGMTRLQWLMLGQKVLAGSGRRLFLFDEAQDLFLSHIGAFFHDTAMFHKGWINDLLENTPVPTIWITNDISWTEPAHLRRFTCILEIPNPPRSVRRRLLERTLKGVGISGEWLDHLAQHEAITPGEISQLGIARRATSATGEQAEGILEEILRDKLPAIGGKPLRRRRPDFGLRYNTNCLNTAPGIGPLLDTLRSAQRATALFYGPPGTGKTELARHLANALDRPLMIKQASDLISPWVGVTEKNIANAFRHAERERAILFLDEADSFLRNRELAQRSWEVTEVNEVLVNMEAYEGVFIAATNLVDDMDPAAFRRFDVKIRFKPLSPKQRLDLFFRLLEQADSKVNVNELHAHLTRMDELTLGDFRAALRSLSLRNAPVDAGSLLEALREEYHFKEDGMRRPMGFVA